MRNPSLRNARALMLLLPLLFAGCFLWDEKSDGTLTPPNTVEILNVILENKDQQPAHLFVKDQYETFPCCQVAAGNQRSVSLSTRQGWDIEVEAGRNGQVITAKACKVTTTHVSRHFMTATFNGSGWSC